MTQIQNHKQKRRQQTKLLASSTVDQGLRIMR